MSYPFSIRRRVEFHDTDMAGILHFTGFFRFMEEAEHAFLRHHQVEVFSQDDEGGLGWPRVSASCDFRSPARFSEELDIEVDLERLGDKSVTYRFLLRREKETLAEGHMTSVCCRARHDGAPESVSIPAEIRKKLEAS